jgi:aminoglycoside phosphotransferase (APT) family kinase protein
MAATFDIDALLAGCRRLPRLATLTRGDLHLLRRKGTSNDHVKLGDSGLVARVPRFSHGGLDAPTNLARQEAAFARAEPSCHTPRLHDVLPIGADLPAGALIVDRIDGHAPRLPDDMAAIADALAALHALPVPPPAGRPPLTRAVDPLTATFEAIEQHAVCLDAAGLVPAARAALDEELAWARDFVAPDPTELPPRFVGADTHPGNFLIDDAGKAWFTDLEKAQYGAVPIDLAHASLATSTGWDPDVTGWLSRADVAAV